MHRISLLFILCCSLCRAQDVLTTEQANDVMRSIIRQLKQCEALDNPIQIDKGWVRMRSGPPIDIKGDLRNAENGEDFFAVIDFTIENAMGSRMFYATEADALADKPTNIGVVERHTHVYRISTGGTSLQAHTLRKKYPHLKNNDYGKPEADNSAGCWEQLTVSAPRQ